MSSMLRSSLVVTAAIIVATAAGAQAASPEITPATKKAYRALSRDKGVKSALKLIEAGDAQTWADQKAIAEIPAPPFHERKRAEDYVRRMRELGLTDVSIDAEGNVVGVRAGSGRGPTLVVSAHLDTVFPEGTDVSVKERDGRFYGPGLSDDSRGLAAVLTILRAMQRENLRTVGDVLFVGTVGEEGLGNLRGVKALLRERKNVDGFITVEPSDAGIDHVSVGATGSRRWAITFNGPGAHSFEAFGTPSAIHAMGRAIAHISDLRPPTDPKTTFTVGVVSGGTSVNTIAAKARMEVDIRSNAADVLKDFEKQVLAATEQAVAEENARWNSDAISVHRELTGDRPAGATPQSSPIVQATIQSNLTLNEAAPALVTNSTDAGAAIALGIPAITLSGGGASGGLHSQQEWFEPREAWLGPQAALLTVLGLVGLQGVSEPLLEVRSAR